MSQWAVGAVVGLSVKEIINFKLERAQDYSIYLFVHDLEGVLVRGSVYWAKDVSRLADPEVKSSLGVTHTVLNIGKPLTDK